MRNLLLGAFHGYATNFMRWRSGWNLLTLQFETLTIRHMETSIPLEMNGTCLI